MRKVNNSFIYGTNHVSYSEGFKKEATAELYDKKFWFRLDKNHNVDIIHENLPAYLESNEGYLKNVVTIPFAGKQFKRLNAERDIKPEIHPEESRLVLADGKGATHLVKSIVMNKKFRTALVRETLKMELNKILNPDINVKNITPQEISKPGTVHHIEYEIYIEFDKGEIALSNMGSGIKTVLLTLLNLIVLPEIEDKPPSNYVFGFEELENNLHPSLQRRLFNYIAEYSKNHGAYFFITTHSNIVIDLFTKNKDAQIVHVESSDSSSTVRRVENDIDGRNILKDLDYKASDLLLSNGIIWVEGPSDVIYLELLLDLYNKRSLSELDSLSFAIQPLSTAIWKYAGFSKEIAWDEINEGGLRNKIVSLQKLNHNHLIVIDNDGNYDNRKPSDWKQFENATGQNKARLIHESLNFSGHTDDELKNYYGDSNDGKLLFWINEGTFETYLEYFIGRSGREFGKFFDKNKTNGYFEKRRVAPHNSISKVELAANVATYIQSNKLTFAHIAPDDSELFNKIKRLVQTIKFWNGVQ